MHGSVLYSVKNLPPHVFPSGHMSFCYKRKENEFFKFKGTNFVYFFFLLDCNSTKIKLFSLNDLQNTKTNQNYQK